MAHFDAESEREPSADDFGAAEKVLARLMPSLERGAPKYEEQRHALATYRAEVGKDMFDLRYGLRQPRNPLERAEADLFQQRITEEQFGEILKADAERPIDVDMLNAFRDAYEQRLLAYSRMLQAVIAIVTDQREPDAWRRREAEVDSHVEEMQKKLPLWKEQVGTVFAFLAELQAERKGEPVRCGDRLAESAHMLACQVMNDAVAFWRSSKEIAHRSLTDPNYLYSTSASKLFYESHLSGLPRIKDIRALMVLEYARALKALQGQIQAKNGSPPAQACKAPLNEQDSTIHAESKHFDLPVTLTEFMRTHCESDGKSDARLHSLKTSLQNAVRRKGAAITLPKHIGAWKPGQKKYYEPSQLRKAWPGLTKHLPFLPPLRETKS